MDQPETGVTLPPGKRELGSEAAEVRVIKDLIAAANARDAVGYAAQFHFPLVGIGEWGVQLIESAAHLRHLGNWDRLSERGWGYSALDEARAIHSSADKVHVALRFTRYTESGEAIEAVRSLYIVTRREGRWGIQVRSSLSG
jgi:hypothetical protein